MRVLGQRGPALDPRRGLGGGLDVGQRSVRVVAGQVAVPDHLGQHDRGPRVDLPVVNVLVTLAGLGVGVAEHDAGAGQDPHLVGVPAGLADPGLDVVVEGAGLVELLVPGEDRVGGRGGEVATGRGLAGLQHHRVALRAVRGGEAPGDVELVARDREVADVAVAQEGARRGVGDDGVGTPGVPERADRGEGLPGPLVALAVAEVGTAAEVLAGGGVGAGHDVPRRAPAGEDVQRRELPGQLVGLVEGRVDRPGQTDVPGDRGQRGEHGEGVRASDDVLVEDLAAAGAQAQPLGEEQQVELPALGGARPVLEGLPVDVAAGGGGAPDGVVVDAREVGAEHDLLPAGPGHAVAPESAGLNAVTASTRAPAA